jgi:hypothetical protein
VAGAILVARSLENEGRLSEQDISRGIDGLPVHTYRDRGEPTMTPCAEFWLSEAGQASLIRNGITPIVPVRGADVVRLVCLQTVSGQTVRWLP